MQREACEKKYHDGVIRLLQSVIQKKKVRPVAKKTILTGLQSRLECTRVTQQREVMSGFTRMQACRDALALLDENGWRRSYHQRLFHDDFIRACTRIFWKREAPGKFAREQCEILRRNNWSHIQQEVLISTPRRFGKTISVSMFAAAMLFSAPGVEISIYATCKRISQKLLRNVVKFFELICKFDANGGGFVGVRSNMEELVVRSTQDPTDVRIINSYPSKVSFMSALHIRMFCSRDTHNRAEQNMCGATPTQLFLSIARVGVLSGLSGTMADEMQCMQTSDAVTDFFEAHGLAKCKEQVCNFMGIETAADLAILTAADVRGTRFQEWATYNLSIVQHRKMLNAFASSLA